MKLILYSDNISPLNRLIDREIPKIINKSIVRIVMILASKDAESFMKEIFNVFLADEFVKVKKTIINSWDSKYDIEALRSADIIFLSGGDTYTFVKNINNNGLRDEILHHVKKNKLLVGASTGSIIITPTIGRRKPEYEMDYKDNTLNLVKFEIEPHYSSEKDADLIEYSKRNNKPIYALPDGSAIIIDGIKEKMLGSVYLFTNGDKALVTCNC